MAIEYETRDHIRIMTFNNPERQNALKVEDFLEMARIEDEFVADPDAWVMIMTGAGDRSFCAGADLEEAVGFATAIAQTKIDPLPKRWFSHCYKPIIAAVNGFALAGGTELVLLSDIRIAADDATFGFPEVRWGLVPWGGGLWNLPHQISFCQAMELLLVGDRIIAEEALRIGMINRIVPKDQVMAEAMAMAERICENGPIALRLIKEATLKSMSLSQEKGFLAEMEIGAAAYATQDAKEGPLAFIEKRKPRFQGK